MLLPGELSDEGVEGASVSGDVEEASSVVDGAAVEEAGADESTVDDGGLEGSDDGGLSVG